MRRIVFTVLAPLMGALVTSLPALAAESDPSSTGSPIGVKAALVVGLLFGIGVTVYTYVGSRFGARPGHHEYAHDIREGVGGHEPHEAEGGPSASP